ncbi:MAG TPA: hypothetical protein PLE99_06730 [Candidatus Thiothrix moscowensis]|uniref:hypothetical protein n=1 Tax=unclassified Thiothrix TaxID=2636184 RepID=UPI0025DFD405|nr:MULTISPECIES: hypothetical protein [unclassified Thiothrix]HRJ52442.1 hypothetical protein [Candidatus Thiothrix moscowensis]HRJ93372.1 hypothetical protein [Candidatus Thiothrix moscowensis]
MDEIHVSIDSTVENRVVAGQYVLESLIAETALATFFRARDRMTLEVDGTESRVILAAVVPTLVAYLGFENTLQRVLEEFDKPTSPLSVAGAYQDADTCWLIYNESAGHTISEIIRQHEHDGKTFSTTEAQAILFNIFRAAKHFISRDGYGFLEPGAILCTGNACKLLNAPLAVVLRVLTGVSTQQRVSLQLESAYISPEVANGLLPVVPDDTFSLAAIAYHLLGGRRPFADASSLQAEVQRLAPVPLAVLGGAGWKVVQQSLAFQRVKRQMLPYDLLQGIAGGVFDEDESPVEQLPKKAGKSGVLPRAMVMTGVGLLLSYGFYHVYQETNIETVARIETQQEVSIVEKPVGVAALTLPVMPKEASGQAVSNVGAEKSLTVSVQQAADTPADQPRPMDNGEAVERALLSSTDSSKKNEENTASEPSNQPTRIVQSRSEPADKKEQKREVAARQPPQPLPSPVTWQPVQPTPVVAYQPPVPPAANVVAQTQVPAAVTYVSTRKVVPVNPTTFVVVGGVAEKTPSPRKVAQVGANTFVVTVD